MASFATYKTVALKLPLSLLSVARLLALASVRLLPVGLLIIWLVVGSQPYAWFSGGHCTGRV